MVKKGTVIGAYWLYPHRGKFKKGYGWGLNRAMLALVPAKSKR